MLPFHQLVTIAVRIVIKYLHLPNDIIHILPASANGYDDDDGDD